MEWRQQSSVSCSHAFVEAQRWIEEVTGKSFGCNDFRAALENGVLLCDLINQLKPGIIKRVNRRSTPIAGLDNVTVFLKACEKLGLNVSQLFDPGDLQDLSNRATLRQDESKRRLKNVLITIYWLGRKAHLDTFYSGPQLNFKAFEGLLGLALSKALDEGSHMYVKNTWYPDREDCLHSRQSYKVENSADSIDFLDPRALNPPSEGCGEEAEQVFKMETTQLPTKQNRGYIPPPLLRKQGLGENRRGFMSPLARGHKIHVRPETPVQVNPGWIWSKSLSDIPMVYPVRKVPDGNIINDVSWNDSVGREWNQEGKQCSTAAKDSEAQWQDDLTKWKNRRRSTKSDRRKSQDREHVINQMINGALTNCERNDAGGLRDQQSASSSNPAPHPSFISSPSKTLSSVPQPHSRAALARSYATEVSFSPAASLGPHNTADAQVATARAMPASDGNILGEETNFASLGSDGAAVITPSLDCSFSSQTQVIAQGSPVHVQPTSELVRPEHVFTNRISSFNMVRQLNESKSAIIKDPIELQYCADPKGQFFCPDPVNQIAAEGLEDRQNQKTSSECAVEQGRAQQPSGVYKNLIQTGSLSGSTSLPRGYRRSEGSCRLSSAITAKPFGSKKSRMSLLPRVCTVDDNQSWLLKSEKEKSLKRQTATTQLSLSQAPVGEKHANQTIHNSTDQLREVKDATPFHTNGYHHQSCTQIQQSLQLYSKLQDSKPKIQTIPSHPSIDHAKVGHSDMRVSLTLKPNSRPDFGFQARWDSTGARVKFIHPGSPAELCQLCVDDEIVAVNGVPVSRMNHSQWKEKMISSLHTGSLTMDIRRYGNKDWSSNEGSHHIQPRQSRTTLNLTTTAPILIGYPNTSAFTGTTVRKTSMFNRQMNNVVQGKVMHGELDDNHRTVRSKGGSEAAISDLQVPSLSPSSSWMWDQEEDRWRQEKWQEEQERLLQEQYQRDQERLEAEWQRAQLDVLGELSKETAQNFEVTAGSESRLNTKGLTNGSREADERNPVELKQTGASNSAEDKIAEQAWTNKCCGCAQLSPAHRTKSLSTPSLAGTRKQITGEERKRKGPSLSKVEQERQQILEEMKKRTQLLTDNSWIRQRSGSVYKEPIYTGVQLKRFDSLDNLDTWRQTSTTNFSYPRPHSVAAGYCTPSKNSSSRYSTGSVLSQRNASADPTHDGSCWSPLHVRSLSYSRLQSK